MFENSNKEIVKEIAQETMKAHRLRNMMACFAIGLTAILITIVCGAGISTVRAIKTESTMNPGPGTNGAGISGGLDVLSKVRAQDEVEWADIARPCSEGTPHNQEFAGLTLKLLGVSDTYYGHNYVDLIAGQYPKNSREILMSDTLAKKIGRKMTPGQKMTLNLAVIRNGQQAVEPVEVTIAGFYKNPLSAIENYEEVYTAEDFPDVYNPELGDSNSKIFTKLSAVTSSTSDSELSEMLEELNDKVGGTGAFWIMSDHFSITIYYGAAAILLLIIACGYFLIYNIFYISIVNDIRFMGNMKTIGMTGKQIRVMLGYQIQRLGAAGTAVGVLAGTLINIYVIRLCRMLDYTFSQFYETRISLIMAIPAAVVFSAATVWISSRKALRLASRVSPVEAARFRTGGRKKTVFAVVSFALSGILFCVLYTTMIGYDTEYMVNRMNEADFRVYQYHADQVMEEPYQPLESQLSNQLESLDFVEECYTYYKPRDFKEISDMGLYDESMGKVKFEGKLKEVIEKEYQESGSEIYGVLPDGNYEIGIMGMEAEALPMEAKQLNIFDGELDSRKFAEGNYLIYQPSDGWGQPSDYQYDILKAGEEIEISFYNDQAQEYVTRTFTVLAVVGGMPDNYAGELAASVTQLVINNRTFREIYGNSADKMLSSVRINTSGGHVKEQQKAIDQIAAETFNSQVRVTSKYMTRISQEAQKAQKTMLGIFVGLIFGFIGMANIVNTLVTGVLSRKIEFAAMQSIGMTSRQMAGNICRDGMKMVLVSLLVMIPIGYIVGKAVADPPVSTGFVPGVYAQAAGMVLMAGVILSVLTSVILTKFLNKKTVVERLREAE